MSTQDQQLPRDLVKGHVGPWRWALVAFGLAIALGIGIWLLEAVTRTDIVVRNSSGKELHGIQVSVTTYYPQRSEERTLDLAVGEEAVLSADKRDVRVDITLPGVGPGSTHSEGVDLWTGERYIFTIDQDLKITGDYDYPPRK